MTLTRRNSLICFASLCLVNVLVQMLVVKSARFAQYPRLFSHSVTVDIVILIPLLYYIFVVRKKIASPGTIAFVVILSAAAAYSILPSGHRLHLNYLKILLPAFELVVFSIAFLRVRKVLKEYNKTKQAVVYFSDALEAVLKKELGNSRLVSIVFTELSLFYYAFAGWFKTFKTNKPGVVFFTYHRKTGFTALSVVMIFVFIVEIVVLHLIVRIWSAPLAWVLTVLGIYAFLWFVGLIPAVRLQPIALDRDRIYIRTGLLWRVTVPLSNIAAVERVTSFDSKKGGHFRISVLGAVNFALDMKGPVIVTGPFGIQKEVRRIGIFIDDAELFVEEMSNRGCL